MVVMYACWGAFLFAYICLLCEFCLWQLTVEGEFYHKSCFRCTHGGCFLTPSSYAALDGFLYCKPHFSQLFKQKGSYNYLSKTASMKKNEVQQVEPATEPTETAKEEQDTVVTQEQ